jgi:hypothetical protein
MNVLETTEQLIAVFEAVRKTMEDASDDQDFIDREYNDLTHALELVSFNASEGYKLAKQLQENRLRRREAKNLKEALQPLYDLMNKNQSFFKELKNVHAAIERTVHTQQNRKYRPRAREDLFSGG